MRTLLVALLLAPLALVPACGGGKNVGGNLTILEGTWFGVREDAGFALATIEIVINATGAITSVQDGENDLGLTGTGAFVAPQVYGFLLSDGTRLGFYVDASATYGAFLHENGTVGVVQKGAIALPGYVRADLDGVWSGASVFVTSGLAYAGLLTSGAVVNPDGTFSGFEGGGHFMQTSGGEMTLDDAVFGRFLGQFVNEFFGTGPIRLLMSADKQFVGGHACSGQFPETCSFVLWNRAP
jgi:hypothetical protein